MMKPIYILLVLLIVSSFNTIGQEMTLGANYVKEIDGRLLTKKDKGLMLVDRDMVIGKESLSHTLEYVYWLFPSQIHLAPNLNDMHLEVYLKCKIEEKSWPKCCRRHFP